MKNLKTNITLVVAICIAIVLMSASPDNHNAPGKINGVTRLSKRTMEELNSIRHKLLQLHDGDSIGNCKIYGGIDEFSYSTPPAEYRIADVPVRLGHETNESSVFSFFAITDRPIIDVECYSSEVCNGFIEKIVDSSGVVLEENWEQNTEFKGKPVTIFYRQWYDKEEGTFSESYTAYKDTKIYDLGPVIKRLSFEHDNLSRCPALPSDEFVTVGGSSEYFFQEAIQSYKDLMDKK